MSKGKVIFEVNRDKVETLYYAYVAMHEKTECDHCEDSIEKGSKAISLCGGDDMFYHISCFLQYVIPEHLK